MFYFDFVTLLKQFSYLLIAYIETTNLLVNVVDLFNRDF